MDDAIHITVPGSPEDPRDDFPLPPGVVLHRSPPLHPDDVTVIDGIAVTSPARTLVDLAESMERHELRTAFCRAGELGLLDVGAVLRARARVEWRPSLSMLDEVIAEFSRDPPTPR